MKPYGRSVFEYLIAIEHLNPGEFGRAGRALHVSYPSQDAQRYAEKHGESPGGDIMIHGIRNGLGFLGPIHRVLDWTEGCIAVTDSEIEELWRATPDGTPIEIRR